MKLLLILSIALIVGCGGSQSRGEQVAGSELTFIHDDARQVGCWIVYYGISCLSDKDY